MKEIRILLGKRIKELRHKSNLSQQQLADLINVETVSISNIERGLSFPSKSLLQLAEVLNVSLPDLFDFESLKLNKKELKEKIIKDIEIFNEEKLLQIYRFIKIIK